MNVKASLSYSTFTVKKYAHKRLYSGNRRVGFGRVR